MDCWLNQMRYRIGYWDGSELIQARGLESPGLLNERSHEKILTAVL